MPYAKPSMVGPICLAIGCTISKSYLRERSTRASMGARRKVARDAIGSRKAYARPHSPLDGLAQPLATLAKEELRDMLGQHVLAGE